MAKDLGKPDRELEELRKKVVEAAQALDARHFKWMLEAARNHFIEQIEKYELQVVRHERFAAEPYQHFLRDATRASEVRDAKQWILEYRMVLNFLLALERLNNHFSALNFGAFFKNWWEENHPFRKA